MSPAAVKWSVQIEGRKQLVKALKVVAETDAPHLKAAFNDAGHMLLGAIESRAPGSMASKTEFQGVLGTGAGIRAAIKTNHPGAKSMEFGRHYWRRGGVRTYHTPGQVPRPFYGIVAGNAAIGAVSDRVEHLITSAIQQEWDRIGGEPGGPEL